MPLAFLYGGSYWIIRLRLTLRAVASGDVVSLTLGSNQFSSRQHFALRA
jgi:hypothetical protein